MIAGEAELPPLPPGADTRAPHHDSRRRTGGGFLGAHWRGELSLARSLWLHAVLPGALAALAAAALAMQVDVTDGPVRLAALGALLAWPLALAVQAWGLVGAWRSAGRSAARPAWIAPAARALVAVLALLALASTAWHDVPRSAMLARLALGGDPQGQVAISTSTDGQRLQLSGWLAPGDAERVLQAAAAAPGARVLEIDSRGGRFQEALRLAGALRGQGWTVRARNQCVDACTVVLSAGAVRQLLPEAQWGITRPAPVSFNPLFKHLAKRRLATLYAGAGVPETLVKTGLALPQAFQWRASWADLAAAGAITTQAYPLDVALPARRDAATAELADTLRSNPHWHGLERRFAGTIAAAAERLRGARDGGAADDAAMLAALETTEPLLAKLLFSASAELRDQYAQLLLQQLRAVRDDKPAACSGLLEGDAAARRALPAALALREAVWLGDAAAEGPRDTAARTPSAIELEVVRRSLGAEAPALLMGLRHPGDAGPRHCDRIAALLAQVQQLPPAERRLAVRLMFEKP